MKVNLPCVNCRTLTRTRWGDAPICLDCLGVLVDDIRRRICRGDYDDAGVSRDDLVLALDHQYCAAKALDVRPVRKD